MDEKMWLNKKVFLETNSGRRYSGKVIAEDDRKIILLDIKNWMVQVSKEEITLIQEER